MLSSHETKHTYRPWLQFNALKHHLLTIRAFLQTHRTAPCDRLRMLLLPLGSSQIDVYIGGLSVEEIGAELEIWLKANGLLNKTAFKNWILQRSQFVTLDLLDESRWVLRLGETEQFVHLHPGRYSKHTVRAKAHPLKTAIATLINARQQSEPVDLALINGVRTHCLHLSPVKAIVQGGDVERLMSLLDPSGMLSTEMQSFIAD